MSLFNSNHPCDMVNFDIILNEIGVITRLQWAQLWIIAIPAIISGMHMTAMVFLGYNQHHQCSMPSKDQITKECNISWTEELAERPRSWKGEPGKLDPCTRLIHQTVNCTFWASGNQTLDPGLEKCDNWTYDTSLFESTVVSDFNLVCDHKQKGRLSQAVFMTGVMLGCAVWGQLSDRFGRRMATIAPMAICIGAGIATAFTKSFLQFTILRFIIGLNILGSFSSAYVLGSEIVRPTHRVWVCQSMNLMFTTGICILPALSYVERQWRRLQLWISIPGFILLLVSWHMIESPRWLLSQGKHRKAGRIIKRFMNGKEKKDSEEIQKLHEVTKSEQGGESAAMKNDTILDILKLPNMRRKSAIQFYIWFAASMLYYGLMMNSGELGGNPFINLLLSALVEIPALLLAIPIVQRWGRRKLLASSLICSGILCVCVMFVPNDLPWLNVTLASVGKFFVTIGFSIAWIYTAELYPTTARNTGLGVCSSWARLGGMTAPFVAMLNVLGFSVPYVVFGIMGAIAGILAFLLPEVLGKKIPETLQEAEEFGK